ncbi:MAG: divalent-cation tolerance protein CutA [Planctomycetota bacterium]
MTDSIAVVLTTVATPEDADRLANALLEAGLVACVQVDGPIMSHYRWQGKQEQSAEYRMMIKIKRSVWATLREKLAEIHPYDVPEIIMLPIEAANDAYHNWVLEQ